MDPITIVGIVGGIVAVLASAMWEGTRLGSLVNPSAALIIFGGTVGATIACYSISEIRMVFSTLPLVFRKRSFTVADVFQIFGEFAALARREGLLVLENRPVKIDSPLLKRGIKLVVDGTEASLLKDLLSTELATIEQKAKGQASIFQTAGGFAPTMGIIGTVMGLVNVLGNLEDPSELGPAISVAFLATLYGIGFANLVLLPLGKKLSFVARLETQFGLLIIEGLLSIQAGDNPRVVQEKLLSLIDEADWDDLRRLQVKLKGAEG